MRKETVYKIIIIDNDIKTTNDLKKIFKKHHCEVDNVDNDKDAVDKILLNNYDYYFISTLINGFYLINLIHDIKLNSRIIAMSSDSSIEHEKHIRACGITYLIKKPFSKKEIKQLIMH